MCSNGNPMDKVLGKVSDCQNQLKLCDKNIFGNIHIVLARKRKELLKAENASMAGRGHARVKVPTNEIKQLMDREECMWKQHSRIEWLQYGDQNTMYFHCRAMERNKRNFISGLENEHGAWVEGKNHIGDLLTRYYSSLFTTTNPTDLDPVLNGVELRVTEDMNSKLLKPFVLAEVLSALKQIDVDTAPGPDGLPLLFYKQFWEKIGREVSKAILTVLNSGTIPISLNHTFISLIPKI